MKEELFSEFADLEALEAQRAQILKIFTDIKNGVKTLSDIGIKIDGAKGVKELGSAQELYNAYIKDTDKLKTQLLASEKKLNDIQSQYAKIIAQNSVALKKQNDELKAQAQLDGAVSGSKERAKAQLKLYRLESEKLNLTTKEGRDRNEELIKSIDKLDAFIKKNSDSLTQQKINIGNYAGSLAKPFELLQKKLNEIKANLAKGVGIGGTDAAALKKGEDAANIISKTLEKSSAAGSTSVKQVRNLTNAVTDLSITIGKSGGTTETSFIEILSDSVAEAQDNVADLKGELQIKASDTQGLDNVVGIIGGLVETAQLAASAYSLMGGSEEDAAKITAKLIALQGISNSVRELGVLVTTRGTAANKAYVVVQGLFATATDKSAAATTRLAAAGKLLVGGLLLVAIGFLVGKMIELSNATDDVADTMKDYGEGVKEATLQTNKVRAAFDQAKQGVLSKKEALKIYNDTLGESFGKTNDLNKAEQLFNEKAPIYIKIMGLKAQANALFAKSAEEAARGVTASSDDQTGFFTKGKSAFLAYLGYTNSALKVANKAQAEGVVEVQKTATEKANKLYEEALKKATEAEALGNKFKIETNKVDPPKDPAKLAKIADNTAQDKLKSVYELAKQELEIIAKKDRDIFDDETQSFNDRLDALKGFTATQQQLIKLETDYEVAQEKLKLQETLKSLEEQKSEVLKNKQFTAAQKSSQVKKINEQEAKEEEASALRLQVIAGNSFAKIIKATEDFNKDLKTLKEGRQKIRDEEKQQIEDYEAWTLAQINKARAAQKDANDKWDQRDKDAKKQAADTIRDYAVKSAEETQATILAFLQGSIDRESQALDTKKRLLDEDTARRINQINMLGLTEQERTKQTAAVEKQAMFETEQIERRKRKLTYERAKLDKAANIASIVSTTALAVIKAYKDLPYPLNIAASIAVAAIGALQVVRAASAPLPAYRVGTENAKKGLAKVSEEGPELMQRNGQLFLTPNEPSILEMAGGEKITPAHITRDILNATSFSKKMLGNGLILLQAQGISSDQADTMISELKEIKRNPPSVHNEIIIENSAYWYNNIKK